jgi:hypothetical protein
MANQNGARGLVPPAHRADRLIGGMYSVDIARPLLGAGGGLPAFAAERRGPGLRTMAVQARADAPPRVQAIAALGTTAIPGLLNPLALGPAQAPDGHDALFVVCPAPPGPALSASFGTAEAKAWSEQDLLHYLLRPVAGALAALAALSVTHRGVRLDNLFRGAAGETVVLGCGWAGPPAALQTAVYEPPYIGMCPPAGRGDGSIADDVYTLGVTMLMLALGRQPMAGLDESEIVRRKLDQGSFKALVGQERLPPIIADLVAGMVAEDPDHRPPPTLLADPVAARARRVAARPHRRAQRSLDVGGRQVWHARSLAHALATEPDGGARLLRSGVVDGWLRRALGESALGGRIEEAVRQRQSDSAGEDPRADAMLAMRAVVALDPLAPLAWEGFSFWPDALGPLLASLNISATAPADQQRPAGRGPQSVPVDASDISAKLTRLIDGEGAIVWAGYRPERSDIVTLRLDMRQHRAKLRLRGWAGGLRRLRFSLNPLLACRSPLLGATPVLRLSDLLPALEAAARAETQGQLPIDRDIAAFVAARDDPQHEALVAALDDRRSGEAALATLHLLSSLQQRHGMPPLPRLAAWLAHHLDDAARSWRNRTRRERCAREMNAVVSAGMLPDMLALVDDPVARETDAAGARAAEAAVREIDAELAAITAGAGGRFETARRIGCEIFTGLALAAVGAMLISVMAG